MKTSIIIPTHNKEEYTIRCIESIRRHTDGYLILWVDDASARESIEAVRHYLEKEAVPYELIAKKENTGFAGAVNLGLARAMDLNSGFVVIQNNDTEVYEGWLDRMTDVAGRDPRIGAVGPLTSPCISWQAVDKLREEFGEFADLPSYHGDPAAYARQIAGLYAGQHLLVRKRLAFFSVLFRNDIVREIGMLSEEYGMGFGEDDDYMLRLRQKGYYGAIAKDVFVFHNHNTTFREKYSAAEIEAMRERNREILYRKFHKGKYRPKDISLIWDIEEAVTYAKHLEQRIKQKEEALRSGNRRLADAEREMKRLQEELDGVKRRLDEVHRSVSWRITGPLRKAWSLLRRG